MIQVQAARYLGFLGPSPAPRGFLPVLDDASLVVEETVITGERGSIHWRVSAIHLPSGASLRWRGVTLIRLVEGRIVDEVTVEDLVCLFDQLAALATPATPAPAFSKSFTAS